MGRLARDSRLETRQARLRLKAQHEPYWRQIHPGLFIGYRKGTRGGVWCVRLQVGKRRVKYTLGTADDHAEADGGAVLSYKQAFEQALSAVNEPGAVESNIPNAAYTVADAMADYLAWYKAHRKAYEATELTVNAHIIPKLGPRRIAQLTSRELMKWHADLIETDDKGKARSKATANRILTVLKAGLNHAWGHGRIESNAAWARVKPFRGAVTPKVRYLTEDECKRLIKACTPDFRLMVQAALLTGCRYGELAKLKAQDFHHKVITLNDTKAGRSRFVPLTDEGAKFFKRVTAGKAGDELLFDHDTVEWRDSKPYVKRIPWGRAHQIRPIREASKRAEIDPPVSFHDLRHTYASLLAMNGVPLQVIARALGHADTRMTEHHYAHLSPDHVSEQIRANLPEFGI